LRGRVRWTLAAVAVGLLSLAGCGKSGSQPRNGVALKRGGELAAWSPDSRWIAAPDISKIDLIDPDGGSVGSNRVAGVRPFIWPCECRLGWSRDSRRILFLARRTQTRAASVGSVDRATGKVHRVSLKVPAGDAAWSPDGWPLVFVANSGAYEFNTPHRGPTPDLWRLDGLHSRPHPLLRQPGNETKPQFSPDGKEIAYLRRLKGERQLWVVDADGSHPRPLATGISSASIAWAPDSRRLALAGSFVGQRRYAIFTVGLSGGPPDRVPGTGSATGAVTWTPDGREITYGDLDGSIWERRPDGGGGRQIGEIPEHLIRRLLWSPDGRHLAYAAALVRDEYD
jgi:dipeptidyl aminopeptidase/acylaminoacyl peptidase